MKYKHLFLTMTCLFIFLPTGFAEEPTLLQHGGGVRTVEFSPVNALLVASAGESNIIKLWNLRKNTVEAFRGHTGRVNSVAFSPNGELLASVSDDKTIRFWNVQSQQKIAIRTITDRYQSIAFSPDGQLLATGGSKHIKLWNVRNRTEIATLQQNQDVRTVAFSPDGRLLAAGDGSGNGPGTVKVWNVQRRRIVVTLDGDPKNIKTVAFSSDNRYLASSGWDGQLKVWNVSNWTLFRTIPHTGYYDVDFSPDGKMLASTNNGYVNLWWVEDGARVARLPGPTDWIHPVDFSPDGTSLAVGAEDGIVRVWDIDTSSESTGKDGSVRILHVDTYLQQLPTGNSVKAGRIPEPASPPAVVRNFFELDPFYKQWINVGGLPVVASAKVNPYAVKEAAWLIEKMIGHRQDVIRAMIGNKTRFSVIGYTEVITEIPEYSIDAPPAFLVSRERGWGGSTRATVSSSEENILSYPGPHSRRYNVLIHEFAHAIHRLGLNSLSSAFDKQLRITYEAAMKKGLWQGTYASSDWKEYWAEGTQAWFHPNGGGSFNHFGNTRQALRRYDPGLVALLTEVYGSRSWRYTPVAIRTHLPHLQGFDPQNSPTFQGWPELEALYRQLGTDPNSDGGGKWVNLKQYNPKQLSHLTKSSVPRDTTMMIFVNFTQTDVLVYSVSSDGTQTFWTRIYPGRVRWTRGGTNRIWLVKDQNGRNIAVFRAEAETGRALIGASTTATNQTPQTDISDNVSQPRVLIAKSQRPPMYWVDTKAGTLHRLVDAKVENLLPSVKNATSLAVDMTHEKLYWAEKTGRRTGRIRRANLDSRNIELVKKLSVPIDITLDTVNKKIYLVNSWGKVQRLNLDGSNFQPNLIRGLKSPNHLALDVEHGKVYWTEKTGRRSGRIRQADLDGRNVELVKNLTGVPSGLAVDSVNGKIYLTNSWGKIQQLNLDGSNFQPNLITGLKSPAEVTVDMAGPKLYWTEKGRIRRANLNGKNIQDIATGLEVPISITLGGSLVHTLSPMAPATTVLSEQTSLLANYPNPFNPETWIPYQLAKSADVTLSIYAVDGRLIRTLALGHQPVGLYESQSRAAYWDGRNEAGEPVASGVYFYTFTAGEFTATRKMLILK